MSSTGSITPQAHLPNLVTDERWVTFIVTKAALQQRNSGDLERSPLALELLERFATGVRVSPEIRGVPVES
jgi:hypothetical protein